jgi:hypothetical protein
MESFGALELLPWVTVRECPPTAVRYCRLDARKRGANTILTASSYPRV